MMNNDYFKIVEKRVLEQMNSPEYREAYRGREQARTDMNHFKEIVEIAQDLWKSHESEEMPLALKIAALCHDLDRIYPKREVNTKNCSKEDYFARKLLHSANSALLFYETNNDLPIQLVHDILYLIIRHEVGGDKDSRGNLMYNEDGFTRSYNLNEAANYLFYSDKLSFFYSGIEEYSKRGKERLVTKIVFSTKGLPDWVLEKIRNIEYSDKIIKEAIKKVLEGEEN